MQTATGFKGVRTITIYDLIDALAAGMQDFRKAPMIGLFFGGLFAVAGWLLIALLWYFGMPYLAYPLAMGFALVAPFAAVGFYAVSDKLAKGQPVTLRDVLASVREAGRRDLRWMALVTGFGLVIWMDVAAFLFFGLMGFQSFGVDFLERLLTTPTGLLFLLLGNATGALIAMAIFSISAVSFPMLYDRDVDFVTAMTTSVRLVVANPVAMVAWCVLIAVLIGISILSIFMGLFLVMPLIGHATWHLYLRAVEPAESAPVLPPSAAA
jgi:uncharacterized membrane protein